MRYSVSEEKISEFKGLISNESADENDIQRFMEENTEFIPTHSLLNHGLHFDCVISKFKIGKWSTDYIYMTKSSAMWKIVLVELEHPSKKIFKRSSKHLAFHSDFNDALAQISTWKDSISKNIVDVKSRLAPLQSRMAGNPMEFSYILVIGRDKGLGDTLYNDRFHSVYKDMNIQVLTWDSIIRMVKRGDCERKCILSEDANGYKIKNMHRIPSHIFAHIGPARLSINPPDIEALISNGYCMGDWLNGEMLVVNEKRPMSKDFLLPSLKK